MKHPLVSMTVVAAFAWSITIAHGICAAGERRWNARALAADAVISHVRLTADGTALELDRGVLIEDDGPAAGYSYQPNEEQISEDIWIKKELLIEDPRTNGVVMLAGAKGMLQFHINGIPLETQVPGKAGNYWQTYQVPPKVLKSGLNEIVVHGTGTIWIARDDEFAAGSLTRTRHPNRSSRSTDGGATWDDQHLGKKGDIDGEYYVRLFLECYRDEGSILLPVFDAGETSNAIIGQPLASIGPIQVRLKSTVAQSGDVSARIRTGTTPVPDSKSWEEWRGLPADGTIQNPKGRYVQLEILLRTSNPVTSPQLHEVVIESESMTSSNWTRCVRVTESHNEKIVRSAIPFEYEAFDNPLLKELRERYQLDEVTSEAASEFELIKRLAAWSATRWDRLRHLGEAYPPWNALEILKPHADGTPVGGFCQQYNVVFLQACESYGLVGRSVSLGPGELTAKIRSGHEVVEIWSNEFKKWIYVDGNYAWYMVDAESNIPLSLWELRQRQLAAFREEPFAPVRLERIIESNEKWEGLKGKPPFVALRLLPRSNFLETAYPLPLNQGMRGWFWTGAHAWTDDQMPAAPLYGNRVNERNNWEWTLNQARYTLEATAMPGEILVHLETETPQFETFLAEIDDAQKSPVKSGFVWKLHPGTNRLRVLPRNRAGRDGITSSVVLEYEAK